LRSGLAKRDGRCDNECMDKFISSPGHPKVFSVAQRHLSRGDPILRALIRHVGPCSLRHDSDHFAVLVRSIISQQI
jgi:3-methyladenine DNA glycosylase/8-oxoguanine DNA glycosylase